MPSSIRWSREQLAEHRQKHGRQNTNPDPPAASAKPAPPPNPPKKKIKLTRERDDAIAEYLAQLKMTGVDMPEFEYRFHPSRRWRADFAWIDEKVLAEYEGGIYTGGAHTRGKHYEGDCEKYNEAALLGFVVLRFTVNMVRSGLALQQTERALRASRQ